MTSRTTRLALYLALLVGLAAPAAADDSQELRDLFAKEWSIRVRENPLLATSIGEHDLDDQLPSVKLEDLRRRNEIWLGILEELDAIDRSKLTDEGEVNYAIFRAQLEDRVAGFRYGAYQIPLNADSGFHSGFARLPDDVPLNDTRDYENYLSRLEAFPVYVRDHITLMRMGLQRGMSLPRVVLTGIEGTMESHLVERPEESVFWAPFTSFPGGVPQDRRADLQERGRQAIRESIVPAYRELRDFMVDEYVPGARTSLGASHLPDGREYYAQRVRHFTTFAITPKEVHEIGLREVERIRAEMQEVIEDVGFVGTFAEFLDFLRTDQRFYAKSAEELLKEAAWISKRMDGKLPMLFKTIPRLPYTVEAVPEHMAPKYTAGRYVGAPIGSTQPGRYWVNTYALDTRPLYNLEALSLHEAVPGHHFQISLNQELEDLPNFRRHSYISAFGEGWGLYSEWLGLEAGFYTDPYSNFGRLTYEMWRACRLVVDTGVHAMGWSRDRMMEFMASRTALSLHEVTTETDRYISWPGQALSYKMGELKIKELRARAEAALAERFDVREFHDEVLVHGSVPLGVLESMIDRWIARQQAADG